MRSVFVLLCTCVPLLLSAQGDEARFRMAVVAGFNATQIGGDDLAGYHKIGGNFGASSYLMFSDKISLSVGVLYNMKGSKSSFSIKNDPVSRKIALDYADVPIMFNYHDKDKAIFSIGFVPGRLVRYKQFINGAPVHDTEENPYSNWSLAAAGGVTFLFAEHYGINLRAELSVISLGKTFPESNLRNLGQYSNSIGIRGMYLF